VSDDDLDPVVLAECQQLAVTWAPVLRALANPERLLIALWLAGTSSSVRELQRVTGLSQSLVSYHLRSLRQAGLVTATAEGRTNRYQLAHEDLNKLAGLVGNLEARPVPGDRQTWRSPPAMPTRGEQPEFRQL
jgi:DNA-binding transcriptional ArsR family regulator